MDKYYGIGTHENGHLDDFVAIKLIKDKGEQIFSEISKAKVVVYGPNTKDNSLFIGIGGGQFDDHVSDTDINGKKTVSATMLVAKKLGIDKNPELERFISYVNANDVYGSSGGEFELPSIVHLFSKHFGNEIAYDFVSKFIDAKVAEQEKFLQAVEEFKKIKIVNFDLGYHNVRIAGIATENDQILKAARSCYNDNYQADILVVFRENGHVQIFKIAYDCMIDFSEIVKKLRIAEFSKKDINFGDIIYKMSNFNTVSEDDVWCYPFETAILNGSFSRPDAPPTKLDRQEIYKAILEAITASY